MNYGFNTRILEISIFIYPYLLQLMEISILLWVSDCDDTVFRLLFPRWVTDFKATWLQGLPSHVILN